MKHSTTVVAGFAVAMTMALSGSVRAGTILDISDFSSDETPASALSAAFSFLVTDDTLTLSVLNQTEAPFEFNISEVYFNGTENISSLALTSAPDGWSLLFDQPADGFGVFDFALVGEVAMNSANIEPMQSAIFTFDIVGQAPFDNAAFTTEFSAIPPGNMPMVIAAKFVNGPNDDSAYGAMVPEPGTLLLLAGGLGLAATRRRHRSRG